MPGETEYGVRLKSMFGDEGVKQMESRMGDAGKTGEKTSKKLGKDFDDAFKKIGKAATVGFAAATAAMAFSVKLASDQEAVYRKLQTSIELAGGSWESTKPKADAYFATMQEITRYGDTTMADSMRQIITLTGDVSKGFEGSKLAADIAATGLFDIRTASQNVALAMSGELMMLARYIPALKETALKQAGVETMSQKAAYAMEVLTEKFGGAAQKDLETFAGGFDQLKNYTGDAVEAMGDAFLPILGEVLSDLAKGAGIIANFVTKHQELTKYVGLSTIAVTGFTAALTGVVVVAPKFIAALGIIKAFMIDIAVPATVIKGAFLALSPFIASIGLAGVVAWKDFSKAITGPADRIQRLDNLMNNYGQTLVEAREFQNSLTDSMTGKFDISQWEDIQKIFDELIKAGWNTRTAFVAAKQIIESGVHFFLPTVNVETVENLATGMERLNEIVSKFGIVTMSQLEEKKESLAELLTHSDIAVRAFAVEELAKVNDEIARLVSMDWAAATEIKPVLNLEGMGEMRIPEMDLKQIAIPVVIDIDLATASFEQLKTLYEKDVFAKAEAEQRKTIIQWTEDQLRIESGELTTAQLIEQTERLEADFAKGMAAMKQSFTAFSSAMMDSISMSYDNQIVSINKSRAAENARWREYEKGARRAGNVGTAEYERQKNAHEKMLADYTKAESAAKREAFETQRLGSIASIIMSTAEAVMKALASIPPPFSIPVAALAAATGAMQLALAAGQKNPYHSGGIIQGNRGEDVLILARAGEMVINEESTQKNKELLNAINTTRDLTIAGSFGGGSGGGMGDDSYNEGVTVVNNFNTTFEDKLLSAGEIAQVSALFERWLAPGVEDAVRRGLIPSIRELLTFRRAYFAGLGRG